SKKFENFSEPLDRYYEVYAFRPAENQVAVIFTDITERKKDEEAIRLANERLELAQQGAGAGWWDWDIQTGKLLWSPEVFGLFGMDSSKNEATFESWRSVIHPDDRKDTEDRIEEAITNHIQLKNESRIVIPDGKIRWINALGNTTYDEQGKAIRMTGICFDITERKKAEELLHYQASLLDNVSDAVMSIDKDLTILSWNKASELMYGWCEEEVKGKSLLQFMKVECLDHTTIEDVLRQVFENGKWAGEVLQQRRDESKFYVSASLTAIKNAAGEHIGFIAVDRDITDRKKAEEALRESEIRYRTIGETSPYGVWITDAEGKCTYVSDSFLEMTGMTMHEVLEFGWMHLLPEEDVEPTKEHWLHCVKTGEYFEHEHQFSSKDGTIHFVLAIGRPVYNEKGDITSWVGINLDITNRKRMEEALRLSEARFRLALRNAPVSVAAQDHDLRYIWAYNQKTAKREEIVGRFDEDIFTPEEAAHFKDIEMRVLIEGSEFSEQMWVSRPSGR
ncbi:MAG: PAS domain S-box protein, partial [Dehalococcoidia bacterium]